MASFHTKIPVSSYNKDEYGYPRCHLNLLLIKNKHNISKILLSRIYYCLVISFFCSNKHSNQITVCFRTSLLKFLFSVVSSEVFFHNTFIIGSHYTQLTDMNYKVTFPLQRTFILTHFQIYVKFVYFFNFLKACPTFGM